GRASHRVHRGHRRQPGGAGAIAVYRAGAAIFSTDAAVSFARPSVVENPVRRLRPSGACQGMVGDGGCRGRHGRRMSRVIPDDVSPRQLAASGPATSAWVSANAGSGKTYVLAQRVIRLLLEGTPAAKILCLTFTKSAAAHMANQVFDTLARWVALDDAALDLAVGRLEGGPPGAA